VAVALVGVPPPGNFRNVLLNISGVRINKTADAFTGAAGWTTIPVPSAAGAGNNQNPGDLQLDLLHTQTGAVFFNVGGVQQGTYQTVQVLVDENNPGTIVPACPSGVTNTEGCINYGATQLSNLNPVIFTLATPLSVSANATAPLVIQLAVSITSAPANTGDPYMIAITPSETNAGSLLASVSGNITVQGTVKGFRLAPLTVSAELSGTNTIIETVPVKAKGFYTLELPAAPSGTSYDIFTSGGGVTYTALQGITVIPGQFIGGQDLTTTATKVGTLSGLVGDACTGIGIPGAQLELLVPAANVTVLPTPRPTPPASFCFDNPQQCVVVASASADQGGNYPLPGTTKNPTGFAQVPIAQSDLALQVSASGYTSLGSSMFLNSSQNALCSAATSPTECIFSLTTGYLNGTVNLMSDPPLGSSVMVQVFAENSGTNQLVSALAQPLVFLNQHTSLPYVLNVPINQPISGVTPPFDLFAVAIDPFQGGPGPFPGHDIPVLANQPAPTAGCLQVNAAAFLPMNCAGHGSVSGTVQNPDTGTSIEVEKLDPTNTPVQVLGTSLALFSSTSPSNNAYTLCVPPDTYAVQRFEAAPASSATASAPSIPVGIAQSVLVPQPDATSSPCPSTCSNTNSGNAPCPGVCNATLASPL
jgi:hypothetical protein